jgi:hypothetical protein
MHDYSILLVEVDGELCVPNGKNLNASLLGWFNPDFDCEAFDDLAFPPILLVSLHVNPIAQRH